MFYYYSVIINKPFKPAIYAQKRLMMLLNKRPEE